MSRFLANENIPKATVARLRNQGHDVLAVAERLAGSSDSLVLQKARQEQRIIVTFDRDYGELIYRQRLAKPAGMGYLRFTPVSPTEPADVLLKLLRDDGIKLADYFTVVDRQQVRQRPL